MAQSTRPISRVSSFDFRRSRSVFLSGQATTPPGIAHIVGFANRSQVHPEVRASCRRGIRIGLSIACFIDAIAPVRATRIQDDIFPEGLWKHLSCGGSRSSFRPTAFPGVPIPSLMFRAPDVVTQLGTKTSILA